MPATKQPVIGSPPEDPKRPEAQSEMRHEGAEEESPQDLAAKPIGNVQLSRDMAEIILGIRAHPANPEKFAEAMKEVFKSLQEDEEYMGFQGRTGEEMLQVSGLALGIGRKDTAPGGYPGSGLTEQQRAGTDVPREAGTFEQKQAGTAPAQRAPSEPVAGRLGSAQEVQAAESKAPGAPPGPQPVQGLQGTKPPEPPKP